MRDSLKQDVRNNGWAMKPPGFVSLDLVAASNEFERIYAQKATESGYENVALLNADEVAKMPVASNLLHQVERHMESIFPSLRFGQLWLVKSKEENVHADVVPFVPHIDNGRYMKAMVYLDDVRPEDGPFTVAWARPDDFEALRKTFSIDYQQRRENVISSIAPEDYCACIGPAGSVIFFDTNCPHFAGPVRGQGQRRIFRFNFFDPSWNRLAIKVRVKHKLRSLLGLAS